MLYFCVFTREMNGKHMFNAFLMNLHHVKNTYSECNSLTLHNE